MEAKSKAEELVTKMYATGGMSWERAKKCAYSCTEEIIMALYDEGIKEPQKWYDVQNEIEKL